MDLNFQNASGDATLLGMIVVLYIYLAPAIVAFTRAHPRFWVILALNVLVLPIQSVISQFFFVFPQPGMTTGALIGIALLLLTGPGWLALMTWALWPVKVPSARLAAWRQTKLFDFVAALPLIAWFANSAMRLRPQLVFNGHLILGGEGDALTILLFLSLLFSALFCLVCVWMLVVRDKPVLRTQGILPRIAAIAGTFLAVGMLRLPVADLSLGMQGTAFLLTGLGSAAAMIILWRLGKSFSIMPEARTLVTDGPYARVRHPLYTAEFVIVLGMILQYRQPWAALIGGAVIALQVVRSVYEERVLSRAFPEYAAYRARTKRFIPGII